MIEKDHDLSLSCQIDLLGISRGSVYYQQRTVPASDLTLMRRIVSFDLPLNFHPLWTRAFPVDTPSGVELASD